LLGIRAQEVIAGPPQASTDITIRGLVEVVERLGPVKVAHVHTPGGVVKCMQGVGASRVGDVLTVSLAQSKCLAFDALTGNRLNLLDH
jgi:hypothetical protein